MSSQHEFRSRDLFGTKDTSDMIYPMKYHRQVEICLLMDGNLTLSVEKKSFLLQPGDLYVVFPYVLHAVDLKHAAKKLWMFSPELIGELPDLTAKRPACPVIRKDSVPATALCLLDQCVRLYVQDKQRYRQILICHSASLMQELLLKLELVETDEQQSFAQWLTGYLMENFRDNITLESASRALGYNKYYISHMVSELFGCNFRTLVNNYRINAAQEALLDKKADILQICYACGFQSQSTFNRAFVKACGMTPSEYRSSRTDPE